MRIPGQVAIAVFWSRMPVWSRLLVPFTLFGVLVTGIFGLYAYQGYKQSLDQKLLEEASDIRKTILSAMISANASTQVLTQLPYVRSALKERKAANNPIWRDIARLLPTASQIQLLRPDKTVLATGVDTRVSLPPFAQVKRRWDSNTELSSTQTDPVMVFLPNGKGDSMMILAHPVVENQHVIGFVVTYLSLKGILNQLSLSPDSGQANYALSLGAEYLACLDGDKRLWQGTVAKCHDTESRKQWSLDLLPDTAFDTPLTLTAALSDEQRGFIIRNTLMDTSVVALLIALMVWASTAILHLGIKRLKQRSEQLLLSNVALSETVNELEQTREEVVSASRLSSLGLMVAGVAHELNTPLAGAKMALTNINVENSDDNTLRCVNMALKYLNRVNRLVTRFKSLAVDRETTDTRAVNLHRLVDEQMHTLWLRHKNKPHRIHNDIDEHISVSTHPGSLSQVLDNLIDNAMMHAFPATQNGTIRISASRQQEQCVVSVSDNGQGIIQDHHSRLFQPFFTTARGEGGTGLGLYICQQLVEKRLNGQLLFTSLKGRGTTFEIHIPVMPA